MEQKTPNLESEVSDTPKKPPRKRRVPTMAVTFRMPRWQVKKLDRIAREESLKQQETIGRADLIRDAILSVWIEGVDRTLTWEKFEKETERNDLNAFFSAVRKTYRGG